MPSELLLGLAIQEKPVHTLAECLHYADIGDLALEQGLLADENQSPEELAALVEEKSIFPVLLEKIPEHFRRDIPLLGKGDIALLWEAVRCMEGAIPLSDAFPHSTHLLEIKGYLYLFAQEGQLWPVFPEELQPIWREAMTDEALLERLEFNQELCAYAGALSNLYGAYSPEQFVVVWNQHHKSKITEEQAAHSLSEMLYFQEYYWLDEGLIVSDSVISDDELDELLSETEDMPYYMPTKSIIAQYADEGIYDESRPELQKMTAFLKTVVPDDVPRRDDLELEIIYCCKEEMHSSLVAEMLARYRFPLEDSQAVETFNRLYQSLFENTRLWTLRGDTPLHYAETTDQRLIPFRLPSVVPRKSKKVGRNAPCPCGSGKKYKHCCGV